MTELAIKDIKIGKRFRDELGDIDTLKDSIKDLKLLQPIVVTPEHVLVAGQRRIEAYKRLGKSTIPAVEIDIKRLAEAEAAENTVRKDFTPREKRAVTKALEERVKKAAKLREQSGTGPSENFSEGNTRDILGAAVGLSGVSLERNNAVFDLEEEWALRAAKPNAAKKTKEVAREIQDIANKLNETGKIEPAYKKAIAVVAKTKPKPKPATGSYSTIVIDPPWPVEKILREVRPNQAEFEYPVMTVDQIAALKMPAATDCHLFLWTTQKFLPAGFNILKDWEFKYVVTMVWHKPGGFQPVGLPQYNCEFVLYARKGSPKFLDTKSFNTCFAAPRREHSRKPDEFYEVIERVCAGPRLDMFSREKRLGFEQWGNETSKFEDTT